MFFFVGTEYPWCLCGRGAALRKIPILCRHQNRLEGSGCRRFLSCDTLTYGSWYFCCKYLTQYACVVLVETCHSLATFHRFYSSFNALLSRGEESPLHAHLSETSHITGNTLTYPRHSRFMHGVFHQPASDCWWNWPYDVAIGLYEALALICRLTSGNNRFLRSFFCWAEPDLIKLV